MTKKKKAVKKIAKKQATATPKRLRVTIDYNPKEWAAMKKLAKSCGLSVYSHVKYSSF